MKASYRRKPKNHHICLHWTLQNVKNGNWDSNRRNFGSNGSFIFDSGASHHMCHSRSYFRKINSIDAFDVTSGHDSTIKGSEVREANYISQDVNDGKKSNLWPCLTNVFYLEDIGVSPLSMGALDNLNFHATSRTHECILINRVNENRTRREFKFFYRLFDCQDQQLYLTMSKEAETRS